jgi:hypothetical protein
MVTMGISPFKERIPMLEPGIEPGNSCSVVGNSDRYTTTLARAGTGGSDNTGQQNLPFFLSHEEKYIILIVLLTLNSNM